VERLDTAREDDHERGCQMRFSMCTCGFDDACARTAGEAAALILTLLAELDAQADAERDRGQSEGFAAAVGWLRDRGAMNPPATLHHAASILADQLELISRPRSQRTMTEQITDDVVWLAYDAARAESRCWRLLDFNGRGAVIVRDMTEIELIEPFEDSTAMIFEKHDFPDRSTAQNYLEWRAIKAGLIAAQVHREKSNDRTK
jgi:hypothetical protein